MSSPRWKPGCAAVFAALLAAPAVRAAGGPYFDAGLALTGASEDNLFATPAAETSDVVTRLTPRLESGYRTGRLSLAARLALDVEQFRDHPELDTLQARRSGAFELSARATRAIDLGAHLAYLSTLDPAELNGPTGIQAGRRRARRLAVTPTATFRTGPRSDLSAEAGWSRDELTGGATSETGTLRLGLARRITPRDRARIDYLYERIAFQETESAAAAGGGPPGASRIEAQAVTFAWERTLSSRSALTLRAGPRFSEGTIDPEIAIELHHGMRNVDLALAYDRTLAGVVGLPEAVVTDGIAPKVSFRPTRRLSISAAPGWYRSRSGDGETTVRRFDLDLSIALNDDLALAASYRRSDQDGLLGSVPALADERIARNTIQVGLLIHEGRRSRQAPQVPGGAAR